MNVFCDRMKHFVLLLAVVLCRPAAAAEGVYISEFMASNSLTSVDEDGDSSDWIELHNPGAAEVNLFAWCLTDAPEDPTKWRLPEVFLPPGAYMVVFASGKDRAVAGSELHTSFKLDADGEYLALLKPDGVTVVSEFEFGPQRTDISHGMGRSVVSSTLVDADAPVDVLVPSDASSSDAWRQYDFALGDAWIHGASGVGYDSSGAGGGLTALNLDINDDDSGESGADDTEDGFDTFTLSQNGKVFDSGISVSFSSLGGAFLDDRDRSTPADDPPDFTQDQLYDDFIFANGADNGDGMRILIEGLVPNQDYELTIWAFDTGSRRDMVSDWIETAGDETVVIQNGYVFDGSILPSADYDDTFSAVLTSSPEGRLRIEGRKAAGPMHGAFVNALRLVQLGFGSLIETDLEAGMRGTNASAFLRIPFTADDPSIFDEMMLRMRYEDGFVAFLNGQQIARRNAPEQPAWNSTATSERPDASAVEFEDIPVTPALNDLRDGENILAVHGLNIDKNDDDFLIQPELLAVEVLEEVPNYFAEATPGDANAQGYLGFVNDTQFDPDRGFYNGSILVTITTATPDAVIYYTTDGTRPSPVNGELYDAPLLLTETTMLRAVACKPGFLPTDVDTHTYIFLDDVLAQTGEGYPTDWGSHPIVYSMDQDVVQDEEYRDTIRADMKSIPSLSIVMPIEDAFGGQSGLYPNATQRGLAWERAASVEWIYGDGSEGFQTNCGVRMHGGSSRNYNSTPKHSFRLYFRGTYGPTKLEYPVFEDSPVQRFDVLVLRACYTDGWGCRYNLPRYYPDDSQYIRDQWMRDAQLAMGHLSAHGTYVHLYVSGLYWGLYNIAERTDSSFAAQHLGGDKDEYDVIKDREAIDGDKVLWNTMQAKANAGLADDAAYRNIQTILDVPNLIDYMILHLYGGAEDWPHHNWAAARRRKAGAKFTFFVWDQEIVLDMIDRDYSEKDASDSPARLHHELKANPEYRMLFADHVQRHLFNNGVLTPQQAASIYRRRSDEIDRAIVGESARWGDYRREQPYTRNVEWVAARDWLFDEYFPQRTDVMIDQFRADGLYPQVDAPVFSQHGGSIPAGFELGMLSENTVYYTTDGSDPREYGGAVSEAAVELTPSIQTLIAPNATARATVPVNGDLGYAWLAEAFNASDWKTGTTGVGYDTNPNYDALINLDIYEEIYDAQTSAFIRVPFILQNTDNVQWLQLKMKYDDGFVAWLNGEKVAGRNAPETVAWNSFAQDGHNDQLAVIYENIDISEHIDSLHTGVNLLAIQALNVSDTSSDLLILPELVAGRMPTVAVNDSVQIKARARNGDEWSALNEARFLLDAGPPLRITEIMYHPPDPPPGSRFNDDDFEFIELINTSEQALDLTGFRFTAGVIFDFAQGSVHGLVPGGRVLVVRNLTAFSQRYDTTGMRIAGATDNNLDNDGEALRLTGPMGETVHEFAYDDAWYPGTDGGGQSLVIIDPAGEPSGWSDPANWRPSSRSGGSPGTHDDPPISGDINVDGCVNIADLLSVRNNLGETADNCEPPSADVNADGQCNVADLLIVRNALGDGTLCP